MDWHSLAKKSINVLIKKTKKKTFEYSKLLDLRVAKETQILI